jgi:hypothetical protein
MGDGGGGDSEEGRSIGGGVSSRFGFTDDEEDGASTSTSIYMSSKPQLNPSTEGNGVFCSHSSTFCFATCGFLWEACCGIMSSSERLLGTKSSANTWEKGSGDDNRGFFLESALTCREAYVKFSLGLKGATWVEADPARADFDI